MSHLAQQYESHGYYGIGILYSDNRLNVGTLWRSAYILGASFIFTVGRKYQVQSSDVTKSWAKMPLFHYPDYESFLSNLPYKAMLIGVEMTSQAVPLSRLEHPKRAVYILGNERSGLSEKLLSRCHQVTCLPGEFSLNVAVAGSIVMYDRISKVPTVLPNRAE